MDSPIDRAVREALETLRIEYVHLPCDLPCDPALADTAAFCAHYGIPPERSANTILVASRREPKRYGVGVVLSTTRLDVNHTMTRLLEVWRLSFAGAEETEKITGMAVGGVTPFALPSDVPVYVDARVMASEWVVLGGGSRTWKIRLAPSQLHRVPNLSVVEGLAQEPSTAA